VTSDRVHIGLAGAVHPNMPGDDTGLYAAVAEKVAALSRTMSFELSVYREPLRSEADGQKARAFMDERGVDFSLLFNASLPFGRVILPFARVRSRLGLWSVPEPASSGVLQLNSFCGTNMLGAIVGNYLNQHDIPFKWFYGQPESPSFLERFGVTLRALAALKALSEARIAQIGDLANGFENLYIDERVLEKKFGTYLQTRYSVEEIVERAKKYSERDVRAELENIRREGSGDPVAVKNELLEKSARVGLALRDFARENGYNALALSCWSRFQEVYGVAVCGALSRLNEQGIVAPCEADVTSAVMMLALNALNGGKAALNDLVAFDEKDSSLNLWHCGVAPSSWADAAGVKWDNHFNIGRYRGEQWEGDGVVAAMQFKPGAVTVASLNNDFDNLFILTGEVTAKPGFAGSSGWVAGLRVNGQPVSIPDLMNTIVVQRVNHHYPSARGDLTNELNELASWTRIRVLEPVPYRPYMQNPSHRIVP
jgi:L-fucose isomerase-like protein